MTPSFYQMVVFPIIAALLWYFGGKIGEAIVIGGVFFGIGSLWVKAELVRKADDAVYWIYMKRFDDLDANTRRTT